MKPKHGGAANRSQAGRHVNVLPKERGRSVTLEEIVPKWGAGGTIGLKKCRVWR